MQAEVSAEHFNMFPFWLRSHLNLTNCFTLVCLSLTLLLIYQELVNFSVTRPTATSKEEKKLDTSILPEVVVCFDPGFDPEVMLKYNYPLIKYYRGANSEDKFVGWNGGGTEKKSSKNILDEILIFDTHFINDEGELVWSLYYKEEHAEKVRVKVKPRILAYPYGRCLSISPPSQKNSSYAKLNSLYLSLRDIPILGNTSLRIFFMDQVNSLQLYPNELEMTGDPIEIKVERPPWKTSYKTQISRYQQVQGDPRFECSVYTEENSYNDCVQKELLELFDKEIGCQPPLLVRDSIHMCDKTFNDSANTTRAKRLSKLFKHVYYHDGMFKCRSPCLTNVYNTRFVHKAQKARDRPTTIVITFDNTVQIFRSTFSIDEQTLLTRLGGSVSSGRTLLWIFLTLLGLFQVAFDQSLLGAHLINFIGGIFHQLLLAHFINYHWHILCYHRWFKGWSGTVFVVLS